MPRTRESGEFRGLASSSTAVLAPELRGLPSHHSRRRAMKPRAPELIRSAGERLVNLTSMTRTTYLDMD